MLHNRTNGGSATTVEYIRSDLNSNGFYLPNFVTNNTSNARMPEAKNVKANYISESTKSEKSNTADTAPAARHF
jgi:ABC-type phosphate transport system substrate-binding protein